MPTKVGCVYNNYSIVDRRYWNKYHRNAYVEAIEETEEGARRTRDTLELVDKVEYVILKYVDGKLRIIV